MVDPFETLSEVGSFFEKIHKVSKNKVQGCSTQKKTIIDTTVNKPVDVVKNHEKTTFLTR